MNEALWYVSRATGIVAWILLTISVAFGIILSARLRAAWVSRPWVLDLHRFVSGLAAVLVGVHIAAIVLHPDAGFGPVETLVPFAAQQWHPVGVAWGVLALYLLLAVGLTSIARDRLPRRLWRSVHYLSFPLWMLATMHYIGSGSDAAAPASIAALAVGSGTVGGLVYRRFTPPPALRSRPSAADTPAWSRRSSPTR